MTSTAKLFKDRVDILEANFTKKKLILDEFLSVLNKRIQIEETYGKSLENLSYICTTIDEENLFGDLITAFRSYHSIKSDQAFSTAESIKNQIIPSVKDFILNQVKLANKYCETVKINDNRMKEMTQNIDILQSILIKSSTELKELEQLKMHFALSSKNDLVHEAKRNMLNKYDNLMKITDAQTANYQKLVLDFNSFKKVFTRQGNESITFHQNFEKNLVSSMKDNMTKFFIIEISNIKSLQYDIDKIIKRIENISFEKITTNKHGDEPPELDLNPLIECEVFGESSQEEKLKDIKKEYKMKPIFSRKEQPIKTSKEFELSWKDKLDGANFCQYNPQYFIDFAIKKENRNDFIKTFFSYQTIKIQPIRELEDHRTEFVYNIISAFLTECLRDRDLLSIKKFIKESSPLIKNNRYSVGPTTQIFFEIESRLHLHEAFKNELFWEFFFEEGSNKENVSDNNYRSILRKIRDSREILSCYIRKQDQIQNVVGKILEKLGFDQKAVIIILEKLFERTDEKHGSKDYFDFWISQVELKLAVKQYFDIYSKENNLIKKEEKRSLIFPQQSHIKQKEDSFTGINRIPIQLNVSDKIRKKIF